MQNVLFVEDTPGCQLAISVALRAGGFGVTVVRDGIAALDYLDRIRPDLILLDMGMPQTSGIEVLQQLRGEPDWATIPVIIFTALTDKPVRAKAEALGVQGYFIKSQVSIRELLAAVHKYSTGTIAATQEENGLRLRQTARPDGGWVMGDRP